MVTKRSDLEATAVSVSALEYSNALAAGKREPCANTVHFNRRRKLLHIELQGGVILGIPVALIQGLGSASVPQIEAVKLLAGGSTLYWPSLDIGMTISGLVSGVFGTEQWMQQIASSFLSRAGRKGGSTSTHAKRISSRANGKLGGRPRKAVTAE